MSPSDRMRTAPAALALAAVALIGLAPAPANAAESYANCTGFIDTLPATVATQGVWCLRKDVAAPIASGTAITIGANNVTVDCNGFKVGGLAAGPATQATGIGATGRSNATVRRCNVRGFAIGIGLSQGRGHVVEDNRLDGNTVVGISTAVQTSLVRRNLVVDTGGGTWSCSSTRIGILGGTLSEIADNTVSGMTPCATTDTGVIGISAHGGFAHGNRVGGLASPFMAWGFYGSGEVTIATRNDITGPAHRGASCFGAPAVLRDNTFNGVVTSIDACIDGGGNVHHP